MVQMSFDYDFTVSVDAEDPNLWNLERHSSSTLLLKKTSPTAAAIRPTTAPLHPYEPLYAFFNDFATPAPSNTPSSKVTQPTPPQHPLQLPPHLIRPRKPNPPRNLAPPPTRQLIPPRQHRRIDNIRANPALDPGRHPRRRLRRRRRHAVRLGVEPRVVRQRRDQLRHERAQAAV